MLGYNQRTFLIAQLFTLTGSFFRILADTALAIPLTSQIKCFFFANHYQDINYSHCIARSPVLKCFHMTDENEHELRKLNLSVTVMYLVSICFKTTFGKKHSLHIVCSLLNASLLLVMKHIRNGKVL